MDDKALAALVVGVLATAVSAFFSWRNWQQNKDKIAFDRETTLRKEREERTVKRRKEITTALTEFYGPFLYYLDVTKALYAPFRVGKPQGFRTLTYLLDPGQSYPTPDGPRQVTLSPSDRALMQRIIDTEDKLEELIRLKGGLVDDPVLLMNYVPPSPEADAPPGAVEGMGLLGLAITHYRVLKMAFGGEIQGEVEKYQHLVYPRKLDDRIKEKIQQLQGELRALDRVPAGS